MAFPVVLVGVMAASALTLMWMGPGFVDCPGRLLPKDRVPVFAPEGGVIRSSTLRDGRFVRQGEVLMVLEDSWPRRNLEILRIESAALRSSLTALEEGLELFRALRTVEEAELRRLVENDRVLFESAALSRAELARSAYRLEAYRAQADRDEAELRSSGMEIRHQLAAKEVETALWSERLDRCRLSAPISGRFFVESSDPSRWSADGFDDRQSGEWVERGRLLGYLIPGTGMEARILIPQNRISRCRPGQEVRMTLEARPQWRYGPINGRLGRVEALAVDGAFPAVVEIHDDPDVLDELQNLGCADLRARIDVRESRK